MAKSVLYLVTSVNPEGGGIAEGVIRYAEALRDLGYRVEIASLDHPKDPWIATSPIKTICLGLGGAFHSRLRRYLPWLRYEYSPKLVPWLKQNADKYDIIVINGLWNYLSLGAWRGLRKSKVPYFVYTHGMLDPWFKQKYPLKHAAKQLFWFFSEGQLLRHAKAVLFTSEEERRLARNAFYPYKVASEVVVGYGTADPPADDGTAKRAFYAQFPLLLEKPFILFLGRLHPKKGCDILIKAFHRVQDRFPYDLVFAGPDQVGWKEELASLAKDLNLSDRIHWTGMLAGDQKWGALRSCEAFILPSHQENFGVAVAEALACGKEVLITNKVNIWREVEQSGVGLVEEDTEQGIVNLLENFLERNKTRISASNHARQVFLSEFALATSTRRLVEVFGS